MSEGADTEIQYPHVEHKGGIDFNDLKGIGKFKYKAASGRELSVEKYVGYLDIHDGKFEMHAELNDGVLENLRLFTQEMDPAKPKSERKYHPDMYASYFLEAFLQECEKEGLEMIEFRDKWMNGSDTYAKYHEVLSKTGDKVKAAQANLFKPLLERGFDYVSNPDQDIWENKYGDGEYNTVHAIFHKRPAEAIQELAA